jgi:hypothetical protein
MFVRPVVFTTLGLLFLAGCRKATVESYRIPKEKDPEVAAAAPAATPDQSPATPAAGGSMANTAVPTAEGTALTWTAPAAWKTKAASAMRKGSYTISGDGGEADLSITAFPGDVGGELANINRWRGQIQLPPVSETEAAALTTRSQHDGLTLTVVDLPGSGANAPRILGAMVPFGGATWFFKLSGPAAVVEKAKPDFLNFLQTVKPAAATAP